MVILVIKLLLVLSPVLQIDLNPKQTTAVYLKVSLSGAEAPGISLSYCQKVDNKCNLYY